MKTFVGRYWWLGAGIFVIAVWLYFLISFNPLPSNSVSFDQYWSWRGTYGDVFGIATSLFSALTVIGVAYGVAKQHEEVQTLMSEAKEDRFLKNFHFYLGQLVTVRDNVSFDKPYQISGLPAIAEITKQIAFSEGQRAATPYLLFIYSILRLIDRQDESIRID
jgi:hypothetical protein